MFTAIGMTWLGRRIYSDAFYKTIDEEYARFAALPYPRDQMRAIGRRVSASIRTVAAFSAWYPVIWRFVARGFAFSIAVAIADAAFMVVTSDDLRTKPLAVAMIVPLVFRLPRRWPYTLFLYL